MSAAKTIRKIQIIKNLPFIMGRLNQKTFTVEVRITVRLFSSFNGLDLAKDSIMLLLGCIETTESKPVKLETSRNCAECSLNNQTIMSMYCCLMKDYNIRKFKRCGHIQLT